MCDLGNKWKSIDALNCKYVVENSNHQCLEQEQNNVLNAPHTKIFCIVVDTMKSNIGCFCVETVL